MRSASAYSVTYAAMIFRSSFGLSFSRRTVSTARTSKAVVPKSACCTGATGHDHQTPMAMDQPEGTAAKDSPTRPLPVCGDAVGVVPDTVLSVLPEVELVDEAGFTGTGEGIAVGSGAAQ